MSPCSAMPQQSGAVPRSARKHTAHLDARRDCCAKPHVAITRPLAGSMGPFLFQNVRRNKTPETSQRYATPHFVLASSMLIRTTITSAAARPANRAPGTTQAKTRSRRAACKVLTELPSAPFLLESTPQRTIPRSTGPCSSPRPHTHYPLALPPNPAKQGLVHHVAGTCTTSLHTTGQATR